MRGASSRCGGTRIRTAAVRLQPAACSTLRRRTLRRHPHRSGGESLHRWWVARVLQRVGRSVLQAHLQAPVRARGACAQVSRTGGESLHHPHRMRLTLCNTLPSQRTRRRSSAR